MAPFICPYSQWKTLASPGPRAVASPDQEQQWPAFALLSVLGKEDFASSLAAAQTRPSASPCATVLRGDTKEKAGGTNTVPTV